MCATFRTTKLDVDESLDLPVIIPSIARSVTDHVPNTHPLLPFREFRAIACNVLLRTVRLWTDCESTSVAGTVGRAAQASGRVATLARVMLMVGSPDWTKNSDSVMSLVRSVYIKERLLMIVLFVRYKEY